MDDIDYEEITRLSPIDRDRTTEVVDLEEVDIFDIGRIITIRDLATRPIEALDTEDGARIDRDYGWYIGVPAVVKRGVLFRWRTVQVDRDQGLGHSSLHGLRYEKRPGRGSARPTSPIRLGTCIGFAGHHGRGGRTKQQLPPGDTI